MRIRSIVMILLILFVASQSARAVTDYIFFSVNGDTSLTVMTQGDLFGWGAKCDTGSTMYWEIWFDVNSNSVAEAGIDKLLSNEIATDGYLLPNIEAPDINPVPDGWYQMQPFILGLAAGQYIFTVLDLADSTSIQAVIINNVMLSPPNQFRGQVTVPGHSAPDSILANVWMESELEDDGDAGYYAAVTDINGYFEINIGNVGNGLNFSVWPGDIDGYLTPTKLGVVASGVVDNIDFVYGAPTDSVFGFLRDDDGTIVTTVGEVYIEKRWTGENQRWTTTTDGRYALFFSDSDAGEWKLSVSAEFIPEYLISWPEYFFSIDTLDSFQKDLVLTNADTAFYVRITENGNLPVNSYVISATSPALSCWTKTVTGTGSGNIATLRVSTSDNSNWFALVETQDYEYPIPEGFILEGGTHYNIAPGDTILFNFISSLSCCVGNMGNIDCAGIIDIGDVTVMINKMFITLDEFCCEAEADVDLSGLVDIGDLTMLINALFITLDPLNPCP